MPYKSSEALRSYNRDYYLRNRNHLLKKQREKNKRLAENRRKWLVEYKKTLLCALRRKSSGYAYFSLQKRLG